MDMVCRKSGEMLLLLAGCQGGAIYGFNLATANVESSTFDLNSAGFGEKLYLHGPTRRCAPFVSDMFLARILGALAFVK
jgi:hypothetical protein